MPKEECYLATCDAYAWLTAAQHKQQHELGDGFYCSAGHRQFFAEETTKEQVERLEKEVAVLESRLVGTVRGSK